VPLLLERELPGAGNPIPLHRNSQTDKSARNIAGIAGQRECNVTSRDPGHAPDERGSSSPSLPSTRDNPLPKEEDMTELKSEVQELTLEELETASGGRMKIPKSDAQIEWEIAKLERDNPGF
jgi:hypothetical protein